MKHMTQRRNAIWLAVALALCLLSAIGSSLIQTAGGHVTVKDMLWETSSGESLSALLFKPDSATDENKAPAIVVSHGWWNNREMQDANYVELARRGYVVVSIDMYGHGNSDPLANADIPVNGTGMYDAVKLVADLPYVDTGRIGIEGHSNGARAANYSVLADNAADTQLISSVLLVDNEAFYKDADGAYTNIYGSRDVGLVADQYDEFFFRSYDAEGDAITKPRDFVTTPNAQSFLNFGADPSKGGTQERAAGQFYTDDVDGTEADRILYTPAQTHPWGPFSKQTTTDVIDYFDHTLSAPNPIASGSQVWQWKEAFNAVGLVGFGIFLVAFARALLFTRAFAGLRRTEEEPARPLARKGLVWFWATMVVSAVVSGVTYVALSQNDDIGALAFNSVPSMFPQGAVFFIALWAAINGGAALLIMLISYFAIGRKAGVDLRAGGMLPGWKKFFQAVLLGLVVVVAAFGIVAVVNYFFTSDFRIWVLAIKWFTPDKVPLALLVLPFFLLYFFANSIAVNVFNRFTLGGREWINTAVLALFNALAPIVLVVVQYWTFFASGELVPGFGGIFSIWLFPVIVILAVAAVVSRKLYRVTNNPYLGGFIMAATVSLVSVTNTLTVVS
ncbi:alpha/beta hydrolase family protein [Cnuibacter sp. UC19_7]|uniref:alpha/beta hydrolase family protein n=1 Tax=Cnuibacter sp. UC19_7 TaxID=3350166 RepID=UPI0036707322